MWSFGYHYICQVFCCIFLQFWGFSRMLNNILARNYMEIWFYFKYKHLKEHFKFCHLGTRQKCFWNIASVEKYWTLVTYLDAWYVTWQFWTKFVNTKGGLSENLISAIWPFGHQCIFQCKNAKKLHLLWFWNMTSRGAKDITFSFKNFYYTSTPRIQKP